jgi:predicted HAD superfamily Cof-like phosphohydrolase
MKKVCDDVEAFYRACDIPVLDSPAVPSDDRIDLIMTLILEEFVETATALGYVVGTDNRTGTLRAVRYKDIGMGDIPDLAKEVCDLVHVTVGAALDFGIPMPEVWDEVHKSNMAKAYPITGEVVRRADGKIIKPEGWQPPDVDKVIASTDSSQERLNTDCVIPPSKDRFSYLRSMFS